MVTSLAVALIAAFTVALVAASLAVALIAALTVALVAALTVALVASLTVALVASLTVALIASLTVALIASLAVALVASLTLRSVALVAAFTAALVTSLAVALIASLGRALCPVIIPCLRRNRSLGRMGSGRFLYSGRLNFLSLNLRTRRLLLHRRCRGRRFRPGRLLLWLWFWLRLGRSRTLDLLLGILRPEHSRQFFLSRLRSACGLRNSFRSFRLRRLLFGHICPGCFCPGCLTSRPFCFWRFCP